MAPWTTPAGDAEHNLRCMKNKEVLPETTSVVRGPHLEWFAVVEVTVNRRATVRQWLQPSMVMLCQFKGWNELGMA
jgi:hypothetical protein